MKMVMTETEMKKIINLEKDGVNITTKITNSQLVEEKNIDQLFQKMKKGYKLKKILFIEYTKDENKAEGEYIIDINPGYIIDLVDTMKPIVCKYITLIVDFIHIFKTSAMPKYTEFKNRWLYPNE